MATTKSAIKIRRSLAVPLIILTIPVTILLSWDGERQDEKYREKFKAVLQEVATTCTKKEENCSGQVKLATDLYSIQYLFSDSFGVNPPL
jgi:hypothetical protein